MGKRGLRWLMTARPTACGWSSGKALRRSGPRSAASRYVRVHPRLMVEVEQAGEATASVGCDELAARRDREDSRDRDGLEFRASQLAAVQVRGARKLGEAHLRSPRRDCGQTRARSEERRVGKECRSRWSP